MTARVLYVTHRTPWPPDRGDRIRTWNVLKFLSARAHVDLLCLSDEPVGTDTRAALTQVTQRLAIVQLPGRRQYVSGLASLLRGHTITQGMFASRAARQVLREWARSASWDAALASSSGIADYTSPQVLGRSVRRWTDLMDVDSQKWADYSSAARWPLNWLYRLEGRRLRHVECQLAADCERLLVVSPAECRVFREFCDTTRIQAVSNGVDTDYFSPGPPPPDGPLSCVFVGVMNYRPNVDAVCWFASEVWPAVRRMHPDARFRIVGKSPAADVRALASQPGIEVVGPVPDVRPWLYQSHAVVVPLRIARGIQNKVLEAMACGRPVICSSAPLQGLQAEPGLHLLRADTPAEWASTVHSLFSDAHRRHELGMAASAWVQLQHGWDACLAPLQELLSTQNIAAPLAREVTR